MTTADLDYQQALEPLPAFGTVTPAERMFRTAASREVAAQLMRQRTPIVIVTGQPGSGKSAFVHEVEAVLEEAGGGAAPRARSVRIG